LSRDAEAPITQREPGPGGWSLEWRDNAAFLIDKNGVESAAMPWQFARFSINGRALVGSPSDTIVIHPLDGRPDLTFAATEPLCASLSPDGNTLYYSDRTGRARRRVITNFAARPR
jgi:hypothetical protein